ncbi:MAG TPA: phytanoyl-CoA dioxygenase family protein [Nitrospiraceae bacterium]
MAGLTIAERISDADVEAYKRDGVVCLRGLFSKDWTDRMYRAIDRVAESGRGVNGTKPGNPGKYFSSFDMWRYDDDFRDFALNSAGPEIAKRLLGQDRVRMYYDQIFLKEPMTQDPSRWHQDIPFWPVQGEDIVSIWVTMTDITVECSGLQYVAGSHLQGEVYGFFTPKESEAETERRTDLPPNYSDPKNREGVNILSWDMKAGDCICHHPMTVHGAAGNASKTQRRLALSVRYLGQDVRYRERPNGLPIAKGTIPKNGDPFADDRFYPAL